MAVVWKALLFLLKCVGILLLVVLGLLLLTVLLVLLAPIRYRGRLDKKEAPEEIFRADGLVSWLNPFLRIRIRYTEKKLRYTVRIFGICLLNSEKPKKEKTKKEKKKKQKKSKRKEKTNQPSGDGFGETENKKDTTTQDTVSESEGKVSETTTEQATGADTISAEGAVSGVSENKDTAGDGEDEEIIGADEKKPSLFEKIRQFFEKVKAIPEKIKQKITQISETLKLLWHKKEKTVAFFEDELHKEALGKGFDTLKQILRHVLPGKIKGHAEFGTGDPESTGKALGVLGMLYASYGKGITVVPDFYEKRLEAELEFKGRIRCGTLLRKVLRLIRDKQVKRFIKNFKKLLKILKQKAE